MYIAVLTEWYIQSGVSGIFSICLSSEMFHVCYYILQHILLILDQLTNQERLQIAERVVRKTAGRVPVVAGGKLYYIQWDLH